MASAYAGLTGWISILALAGCVMDDGFVDPLNPPKPMLGHFQGRAKNEGDTSLSADRFLNLSNPQVTLVWKFLGPKEFIITPGQASVNTQPPYLFDLRLLDPPSPDVLDNPDLAIGGFWLFSDRNGNGALDRLIHPEMAVATGKIDSLYGIYQTALRDLAASGDVLAEGVDVLETYHVGRFGTVTLGPAGDEDTLFAGHSAADTAFLPNLLNSRFTTLKYPNRWEKFFALRKRDNDYYYVSRPSPDHILAVDMPIKRRLFPKPGGRHEFERKMRAVVAALNDYVHTGEKLLSEQIRLGHNQYPFDGFNEPGADWVAGRSRNDFILYIKDESALRELREAEKASSFTMKGMDQLRTGYNAVRCDDQYSCEFLEPGSALAIDLGQTEEYFNPPSSPTRKPIAVIKPSGTPVADLQRLAGSYAYLPLNPVRIAVAGGALWAEMPGEGMLRLTAADSLLYYASDRDLQFQFVTDDSGQVYKLFIFKGKKKYVATRDSSSGPGDLALRAEPMLAAGVPIDARLGALFAASAYAYGKDTLKAGWTGDSLRVTVPGMLPVAMAARDSLSFFSRQSDLQVDFELDAGGKCAGAWVTRAGVKRMAPALGYRAPGPADLFPGISESLTREVSGHEGTGRDRFPSFDGGPRFAAGPDSLFLRPGDGWLEGVGGVGKEGGEGGKGGEGGEGASDSISFRQGGDFLRFRIPGLAGQAMAIELTFCPQRGAKGRVRMSLRGGDDPGIQADTLGGDFWVELDGSPKTVTLGPWRAHADPYYVRIEQVPTADTPFLYSFDGYRVLTE